MRWTRAYGPDEIRFESMRWTRDAKARAHGSYSLIAT